MHCAIRLILGALSLCGVATAQAQLVANPDELEFPIGYVGITSSPLYVTLKNTGNTSLSVVSLSAAGGAYARAGGSCGTVPFSLAAQASCTLGYTFTPFFVGPTSATLRATPDIGNFVNFRLVGEGEVGGLRAEPSQLMFPLQAVGATVGPLNVTLRNTSAASLTIVSLTSATGVYARVGGSCGAVPITLAAQASCTLGYTFSPNSVGTVYQSLRATPNAGAFADFTLAGEADRGDLTVQPSNIRFMPPIAVGDVSDESYATLENTGRVPMQVLAIVPFQPPPVVSFVRSGGSCSDPPFTLFAFASCSVGYTFVPIAAGEVTMDIRVGNSVGSAEPVTLSGLGLAEIAIFASGFE